MKAEDKLAPNSKLKRNKNETSISEFCKQADSNEKSLKSNSSIANPPEEKKQKIEKSKKQKKSNVVNEKPILTENEIRKRRNKKTRVALSCFVLILAVGVVGNWYWENSDISTKVNTVASQKTKTLGEATFVDATTEVTTENEYFSSARMDRQSARDESIEKLQKIVDSVDESEAAHKDAANKIAQISDYINIENKIETLVKAKGISNCIAVINEKGEKVDVIVDTKELTDIIVLQVKEIAVRQLGCSYDNVTIIQSK